MAICPALMLGTTNMMVTWGLLQKRGQYLSRTHGLQGAIRYDLALLLFGWCGIRILFGAGQ